MILANHLNIAGVIGTTVGSFLVWYFLAKGIKENISEFISGEENSYSFTIPTPTKELRTRLRKEVLLSRLGIVLIATGGALQITASLM